MDEKVSSYSCNHENDSISRQVTIAQPKNTCENTCEVARTANDCISRQAAIDVMFDFQEGHGRLYAVIDLEEFNALPSVQPERKTGKWILSDNQNPEDTRNGNYLFICSNCLFADIHAKTAEVPFCWHCGADMREETGGTK